MADRTKVDAYIKKHEQWSGLFSSMRKVLQGADLTETVKWGAPSYTLDGKIVVGFVGFKNHCALWFQQGVFLKDKSGVLVNAQEGTTRGMRQWRFEAGDKLDTKLLKAYVQEAMDNQRAGKQIKPASKELVIPDEFSAALNKSASLRKAFEALTPGRQREYAAHISSAKQEKTRLSRLGKITPRIIEGVGLNDQYKNS